MVAGDVFAAPGFDGCPRFVGRDPKNVVGWKTECEEAVGANVETAGGNIVIGKRGLVSAETDLEPAVFIEGAGGAHLTTDDGVECAADLRGRDAGGELFAEGELGERLKCAEAINE